MSEGISQSGRQAGRQAGNQAVSQSEENSIKLKKIKFRDNFLKAFRVNLKVCLGLVLPNQYYPIVVWEIKAGFQVILLRGPCLLLGLPYYEPLL